MQSPSHPFNSWQKITHNLSMGPGPTVERLEDRILLSAGLSVVSLRPVGTADHPFDLLDISFSQQVQDASFTTADVTMTGPGGSIVPTIRKIDDTTYELDSTGLTDLSNYTLVLGPGILDQAGNPMDQNHDGTAGQVPQDAYRAQLCAAGLNVASGDPTYDGWNLVLCGGSYTIDGSHAFGSLELLDGAVLTESASTETQAADMDLTITDALTIDATSKIDVSGAGYLYGRTEGNSTDGGAQNTAGGSYGGIGYDLYNQTWGEAEYPHAKTYGDYSNPTEPGAGGGGFAGGSGGGLVRISAASADIDGAIVADGGAGVERGAGSGGGIRLDVGTLSGGGTISANGGEASSAYKYPNNGGGGGGRVAVYYQTLSGFDLSQVTALGGSFSGAAGAGSPGTVYLDQAGQGGQLRIDGHNAPSGMWTPLGVAGDAALTVSDLVIAGTGTRVQPEHQLPIQVDNLTISGGAVLTHQAATDTQVYSLDITVSGTLSIDAESKIDVTGMGYLPGRTSGNTLGLANQGASYGGIGWLSDNPGYGDFTNPTEPGSGDTGGAAGGGLVRITAATADIEGAILANGGVAVNGNWSGGGSGGGIYLDVGTLEGGGTIWADGGDAYIAGGGGRVAVYYDSLSGFGVNQVAAIGGRQSATSSAGVGTIYLQQTGHDGELLIDSHGAPAGMWTPLGLPGDSAFTVHDLVINGAGALAKPAHQMPIQVTNLTLSNGGTLSQLACTDTQTYWLDLSVAGTLSIDGSSKIDVSGMGYSAGRTHNNSTQGASQDESGGSYGGLGGGFESAGQSGWTPGLSYGDYSNPMEPGAGGAGADAYQERAGGGLARISAATVILDGSILALGGDGGGGGAGSGGGIYLDADTISGGGSIQADGGSSFDDGAGGGGRVAIYYDTLAGFDLDNVEALGGQSGIDGGGGSVGTVFLQQTGQDGQLILDNHGISNAHWTPLGVPDDTEFQAVNLVLRGTGVVAVPEHQMPIVVSNLTISGGAVLSHLAATITTTYWLDLTVSGTLDVDAQSSIDVTGKGYLPGRSDGNSPVSGGVTSGGSYGGVGYSFSQTTPSKAYGDFRNPTQPGAGSGSAGGGLARITAGTAIIDGSIVADGGTNGSYGYTGSGGGIWLQVGTLSGSGSIHADGGTIMYWGGGASGGGGRVAVYYDQLNGFDLGNVTAAGGTVSSGDSGAPGTVYLQQTGQEGLLRIDNLGLTAGAITPLGKAFDSDFEVDNMVVSGQGVVVVWDHPMPIRVGSLSISGGAILSHPPSTKYVTESLTLVVAGDLSIATGSGIDVSGMGYLPGYTQGNRYIIGSGGGSYGGAGGGKSLPTYGDPNYPNEPGGGGMPGYYVSSGGGQVSITAGTIELDGFILADGQAGDSTGGAGGAIRINTGELSGTGTIQAAGGQGKIQGSLSGGGGRVAVYTWMSQNLPTANITAPGGAAMGVYGKAGQDGTVTFPGVQFYLPAPQDQYYHGTESVQWDVLGVDPSTVTMDLYVTNGGTTVTLAQGASAASGVAWDTTTGPDGLYTLQAVFHDSDGNVLADQSQNVTVYNAVAWHSGLIVANQTWSADKVHVVTATIQVAAGVTLTILPGAIVKFARGTTLDVAGGGTLNAEATNDQPIILTSLADDTAGGDTNQDGDATQPSPGEWFGVAGEAGSTVNLSTHVQERYVTLTFSGTLGSSQVWLADSTHYITADLTIPAGVTLTIQPGAIVKLAGMVNIIVEDGGALVAQGSTALPVIFTSDKDDTVGGDTNGDGNLTTPSAGDWSAVCIQGQATLDHVEIRYGGASNWFFLHGYNAALLVGSGEYQDPVSSTASVTLSNSTIEDSLWGGVGTWGGSLTISNSLFLRNDDALYLHFGTTQVVNCTIDGNRVGALMGGLDQIGEVIGHINSLTLINSLVTNNSYAGVEDDAAPPNTVYSCSIRYSDVWSPSGLGSTNYLGVDASDQAGQNGNVSVDPKYRNSSEGDYGLNYLSPVIDAGDGTAAPATDITGAPRYNDPRTLNKTGVVDAGGIYPDMGAYEFVETAQSSTDLAAGDVTGPATATVGQTVTVYWTVTNAGNSTITGPWRDAVYLSLSGQGDSSSRSLAGEAVEGEGVTLQPGQSFMASAQVTVPAGYVGANFWEVVVNDRGDVFEGSNLQNNTADSAVGVDLSYPQLALDGPPSNGQFTGGGSSQWYIIQPSSAGQDILLNLDLDLGGSGVTELYVSAGMPVTRSGHDWAANSSGGADQQIEIPNADPNETYYVLAYAASARAGDTFTISAQTPTLAVGEVSPSTGGNVGNVTVGIQGTAIPAGVQPVLIAPDGTKYYGGSLYYVDPTQVYATFDLAGAAVGTYALRLIAPDGSSVTSAAAFQVAAGHGPQLEARVIVPSVVRTGRPYSFQIEYSNQGDTDLISPILHLSVSDNRKLGLQPGEDDGEGSLDLLGYSATGPAGILRPGETQDITVYSTASTTGGTTSVEYNLGSQTVDPLHPRFDLINWVSLASQYGIPLGLSNPIWETFIEQMGQTWDELNAHLASMLTQQVQAGQAPDAVVGDLMQEAYADAMGRGGGLGDTELPWILCASPIEGHHSIAAVDIIFSKTIDPATFTAAGISLSGPGGAVDCVVTQISDRIYEITFQSGGTDVNLSTQGIYTLSLASTIADANGLRLDQDRDGVGGEAVDDAFTTSFAIGANQLLVPVLYVVGQSLNGDVDVATGNGLGPIAQDNVPAPGPYTDPGVDHVTIQFSEPIQFLTFTPRDVVVKAPDGSTVPVTAVVQVSSVLWDVQFLRQTGLGQYTVTVDNGPEDLGGNPLDQDLDGTIGQGPQDQYTGTFTLVDVHGPRVVAQTPDEYVVSAIDHVDLAFSEAINPASLTPADITLTGPSGAVAITGITEIDATDFRVSFNPLAAQGRYNLLVGPSVTDLAGNAMDQDQDGVNGTTADVYAGSFLLAVDPTTTVQIDAQQNVQKLALTGLSGGSDPTDEVVIKGSITYGGTLGGFFAVPHVRVQLWEVHGAKDVSPGVPGAGDASPDELISSVNALTGSGDLSSLGNYVFNTTVSGTPILKTDVQDGGILPWFYVVVIAQNDCATVYDWSSRRAVDPLPGNSMWAYYNPDGKAAAWVPKVMVASSVWISSADQPGLNTEVHTLNVQVNSDQFGPAEWIKFGASQFTSDFGQIRGPIAVIASFGPADEAFYRADADFIALGSNQIKYPAAILHEYGHSIQNAANGFKGLGDPANPSSGTTADGKQLEVPYGIIQESQGEVSPDGKTNWTDAVPKKYYLDVAYEEAWASFVAAYCLRNFAIWDNTAITDAIDRARSNPAYLNSNNWWMGYDAYGYATNLAADEGVLRPENLSATFLADGNGVNKDANTGDEVLGGVISVFWAIANSGPNGPRDLWTALKKASGPSANLDTFWNALPHTNAYETIFLNNGVPITDKGKLVDDEYEPNDTQGAAADITPVTDVAGDSLGPIRLNNLVMAESKPDFGDWYQFDVPEDSYAAPGKTRDVTIQLDWQPTYGDLDAFAENTTTGDEEAVTMKREADGTILLVFHDVDATKTNHFVVGVTGFGALNADGSYTGFGGDFVPDYSLTIDWSGLPVPTQDDPGPHTPPNQPWPYDWLPEGNQEGASHDPNAMVGPAGAGSQGYVPVGQVLPYTVEFENSGTAATLPAQEVHVTNLLDSDLDLSTFALTSICFGDHVIQVPAQDARYFQTTVDISTHLSVQIEAGLDLGAGTVFCNLLSIDPTTGQAPADPTVGVLPVDDGTGSGEGYLSYAISPKTNLPTGRQITNQASIVFDTNAPMNTAVVLNTIDAAPPASQITTASGSQGNDKIQLAWSGHDDTGGSGIASYDIYVSVDGGSYLRFLSGTTATSATYAADPNHTYRFYSVATDNVGNAEAVPATPDATITTWPTESKTLKKGSASWSFTDSDGTAVTLMYTGAGQAVVERWKSSANKGDIRNVTITGDSGTGTLTITTTGTGQAAVTSVENIHVVGSFGSITAKTTNLLGGVAIDGTLSTLAMGSAFSGSAVSIGQVAKSTVKPALTFDQVQDLTVTSLSPIGSITCTDWMNDTGTADVIQAPSLGTLSVPGKAANAALHQIAISGDFQASLTLQGVAGSTLATLGSATIAGAVTGGTWGIKGKSGAIKIGGDVGNWTLQGLDAGDPLTAVTSLTTGDVFSGSVTTTGTIGTLSAKSWDGGTINAAVLTSLTTKGNLGANINLAGPATTAVLGTANIGAIFISTWDIKGKAGAITVTGTVNNWTLQGLDANDPLTAVTSLTTGDVFGGSVTTTGTLGTLSAKSWNGGTIQAASLTSLTTTGNFGAGITLSGPATTVLGASTIGGAITGGTWSVVGAAAAISAKSSAPAWTATFSGVVTSLTATGGGIMGNITAGRIGTLSAKGDVGAALTLTAKDATNKSLGSFTTTGNVSGGTWTLAGGAGAIEAGSFASGWTANFGVAGSWAGVTSITSHAGDISGQVTAFSIGAVSAKQSLTNATLDLKQGPSATIMAISTLSAGAWIQGSTIGSAGTIGTVTTGGIKNSSIFAGVANTADVQGAGGQPDGVLDLPQAADLAPAQGGLLASIKSLTVKGLKDAHGSPITSYINTNIAAGSLGSVSLCYAGLANGSAPMGLTTGSTTAFGLTYKDATPAHSYTWKKANGSNLPAWFDDFLLRMP